VAPRVIIYLVPQQYYVAGPLAGRWRNEVRSPTGDCCSWCVLLALPYSDRRVAWYLRPPEGGACGYLRLRRRPGPSGPGLRYWV